MKNNPSRDQLTKSLDRRIRHLMIRTLEKFEDKFPDLDQTRDGKVFKGDIRTIFNDVLRAQRDEIRDYDVEYRPLKLTDDNVLALTQTFMQSLQGLEFDVDENDNPYVTFYANPEHRRVLEALRAEVGAGVIVFSKDVDLLEIRGIGPCINCVLPILDKYRLHSNIEPSYGEWRDRVVKIYRS